MGAVTSTTFATRPTDVHRSVDDTPFGGGAGMVLRAEPIMRTVDATPDLARPVIALTPSGGVFTHDVARELARPRRASRCSAGATRASTSARSTSSSTTRSPSGDFVLAGGRARGAVRDRGGRAPACPARSATTTSSARRVLQRRAARVPAVHEAGRRCAGRRGARGAALGRPRADRALAPRPGAAPDAGAPSRPDRAPRGTERRGARRCWPNSRRWMSTGRSG